MTAEADYAPYLAPHLDDGETLRVVCVGSRRPQGRTFRARGATGAWRVLEPLGDALSPTQAIDWLLFGRAAGGDFSSVAAKLLSSEVSPTTSSGLLALTDRRLLWGGLTGRPLGHWTYQEAGRAVPDDLVLVRFSTGRDTLAGARVGRYRLRPGRLWVHFTDGSWVAFTGREQRECHERIAAELGPLRI